MLHKVKGNWSVVSLLLLQNLLIAISSSYIKLTVESSSTQINLPSTYTFTINRQYDPVNFIFIPSPAAVPLNTSIVLTLPSQFTAISTTPTLSCINSASSQSLTCTVNVASKTITISDYYATSATLANTLITVNIYNLINAYKAGASDNFQWKLYAPNAAQPFETGPDVTNTVYSTSISFTAGTFQCNPPPTQPAPSRLPEPTSAATRPSTSPSSPTIPSPPQDSWCSPSRPTGPATRSKPPPSRPRPPALE
jgi:hypothetical protein